MKQGEEPQYVKRSQRDYSYGFKIQVVQEIERGEESTTSAQRKYGIQSRSTVMNWLRKYGVNYCPVTACASSTQSIIQAFNYIRLGKADLIISGGSEAPITEASIGGFNAMKAMSTNNDNYTSASKPFDVGRDGLSLAKEQEL